MKYIKKLNIDFDQWDKLPNSGWFDMKFIEGKTIDYYKRIYPEGTKVRIKKDTIYYYNDIVPRGTIGYLDRYINYNNIIKRNNYFIFVKWNNIIDKFIYKIIDLEYYKE